MGRACSEPSVSVSLVSLMGLEVGRGTAPVCAFGAHVRGARTPLCRVFRSTAAGEPRPSKPPASASRPRKKYTRVSSRDAREQKSLLVVSEYGVVLYVLFLCMRELVLFFLWRVVFGSDLCDMDMMYRTTEHDYVGWTWKVECSRIRVLSRETRKSATQALSLALGFCLHACCLRFFYFGYACGSLEEKKAGFRSLARV